MRRVFVERARALVALGILLAIALATEAGRRWD
jgi:hypothetical protein